MQVVRDTLLMCGSGVVTDGTVTLALFCMRIFRPQVVHCVGKAVLNGAMEGEPPRTVRVIAEMNDNLTPREEEGVAITRSCDGSISRFQGSIFLGYCPVFE